MTSNKNAEKDIHQQVDYMTLQNQITFCEFKICLDELTTRLDNVTLLVKGMVAGPQPHFEGPPTVPLVIGRLVDLIREHHPDVHRLSGAGQPAMHLIFYMVLQRVRLVQRYYKLV